MNRYTRRDRIQSLDPLQDNEQICHLLAGYEFPWDVTRALEFALLKTFCVPSISALVDRTGEFQHRTQKRYDDTGLIIGEILQHGYSTPRGTEAIQRMNQIHGRFSIRNEDFLYVLSTFIFEPIWWIDRFGWRSLLQVEKDALFYFWMAVGDRMNIHNIPSTYTEFEAYEQEFFQHSPTNQRVATATEQMFLSWFPALLRPVVKSSSRSLLSPSMQSALGNPPASKVMNMGTTTLLKSRSWLARVLPARENAEFFTQQPNRTYPNGYRIAELGPDGQQD